MRNRDEKLALKRPFIVLMRGPSAAVAYSPDLRGNVDGIIARYDFGWTVGERLKATIARRLPQKPCALNLDPILRTFGVATSSLFKLVTKYAGRKVTDAIFVWDPDFTGSERRVDAYLYERKGSLVGVTILGEGRAAANALKEIPEVVDGHPLLGRLAFRRAKVLNRETSDALGILVLQADDDRLPSASTNG